MNWSLHFRRFLATLGKPLTKEKQIERVLLAMGWSLHAPEQSGRCKWNRHAIYVSHDNIFGGLGIINSSRQTHQVHDDFISDADNAVLLEFAGFELAHGIIWQSRKCRKNLSLVVSISGDNQIDIHCLPQIICRAH